MQETIETLRDDLIVKAAKSVTDVISAAVAVVTWASICSLVVIGVWHRDGTFLLSHGRATYWIVNAICGVVTLIAASTSIAGFIALYAMIEVFRKNFEKHVNLVTAVPYAAVLTFLPHSLLVFAVLSVVMLAMPAAIALGFIAR